MITGDVTITEVIAQFGLSGIFLVISYMLWRDTKEERAKRDALGERFIDVVSKNTTAFKDSSDSTNNLKEAINKLTDVVDGLAARK